MLFIKSILNKFWKQKELNKKQDFSSGIFVSIDAKNTVSIDIDIPDPDSLTPNEISENAEKTALVISSIINGDLNNQIIKSINKSSKSISDTANSNLYFQNVLSFYELQQKEKLDQVKEKLYDKAVIRPSEAFSKYA